MKKTLKTFLLTLLFLAVLALFSNVKANSISKISMDIYVDNSGTAHVTETWKCSASEGTEVYHPYYNLGNSKIQNLVVYDETQTYDTLSYWNTSGSLSSKAYKCGINKISNGVELCWGISKYGSHTYIVKYDITNFVSELSDGNQMIYWTLIPYDFSNTIGNVYIKIHTTFNMTNTVNVWGYGNKGTAYVSDGCIQMNSNGKLPSSNYMTILAKFPKGTFNATNKLNHDFNYYFNMSKQGAKKNSQTTSDEKIMFMFFIFLIIPIALLPLLIPILGNIIIAFFKKHSPLIPKYNLGTTKRELKNAEYFRDIPCDNLCKAYFLAYHSGILKNKNDIFGAVILKWIKEGILTIDTTTRNPSITLSDTAFEDISDDNEYSLLHDLSDALKYGKNDSKKFKKWCKKNYKLILNWFDDIISSWETKLINYGEITVKTKKVLFINKKKYFFQPSLTQELKNLAGLRRYLIDYTLIKEREPIEVHLFENYLIYAQMFGIAKKVAKQFKKLYPDIVETSCYLTYDDFLLIHTLSTSIISSVNTSSSINNILNSISSAVDGGGYSSSGGGGGSFGGGGGGGGFR